MQNGKWLEMMSFNRIKYNLTLTDGSKKEGFLRFTKGQSDRYAEYLENVSKTDNLVKYNEVAEIILNPDVNKIEFTKEMIDEIFDLDELRILVDLWLEKKVLKPKLSKELDPNFF